MCTWGRKTTLPILPQTTSFPKPGPPLTITFRFQNMIGVTLRKKCRCGVREKENHATKLSWLQNINSRRILVLFELSKVNKIVFNCRFSHNEVQLYDMKCFRHLLEIKHSQFFVFLYNLLAIHRSHITSSSNKIQKTLRNPRNSLRSLSYFHRETREVDL